MVRHSDAIVACAGEHLRNGRADLAGADDDGIFHGGPGELI